MNTQPFAGLAGLVSIVALLGCDGIITGSSTDSTDHFDNGSDLDPGREVGENGPMLSVSLTETDEDFLNPERGFYVGVDLTSPASIAEVRNGGHSLAIALVRLDAYRDQPIDAAFLQTLDQGFEAVRQAGIKVVLRFMYNSAFTEDAPKSIILGHLQQLQPLLHDNQDVIAVMQAGFIGAWGEWHGSTNGLDNDADRGDILRAILAALPTSRFVQIRAPMYKSATFPGEPVNAVEAYSSTDRARVGHHNDCFLASDTDLGTFAEPVTEWESYVSLDTLYTPNGGETCKVYQPKIECESATAIMAAQHFSYLNSQYHQDVLGHWAQAGCYSQISRDLGYRLAALQVSHSEQVAPGGILDVEVELRNRGYAAPYNERPVYLVLRGQDSRHMVRLSQPDPRHWLPDDDIRVSTRVRVPADLEPGNYTLSLWMPDAADSLQSDPRYAIRLANEGTWDADTGENILTQELSVDPAAGGSIDPSAERMIEL